jgi:hypothetical protein
MTVSIVAGIWSGHAGAESLGFEGLWGRVGTQCASSGDLVPTEITNSEIRYYESSCSFVQVDPVGEYGTTWNATVECSGEGTTWQETFVIAIHDLDQGQMLSMIDMTDGYARLSERCG